MSRYHQFSSCKLNAQPATAAAALCSLRQRLLRTAVSALSLVHVFVFAHLLACCGAWCNPQQLVVRDYVFVRPLAFGGAGQDQGRAQDHI
jgi:hypothetical protein